jgi:hypothetical protein
LELFVVTQDHACLRDAIREALGPWRRFVIALDGVDAAGKSTLARYLAWQLGMPAIETDLYFDAAAGYLLAIADGIAVATLTNLTDPIPPDLLASIEHKLHGLMSARQLLTHTPYTLEGPRIIQHRADGNRTVALTTGARAVLVTGGQADFIIQDSSGKIVKDSKAERIADHLAFIEVVGNALGKHPLLHKLLKSYNTAVNDPANELVHLYEIREAIGKHYRGETQARLALGITRGQWQRLGGLANDEPLKEGRHRGKHPGGLRNATPEELNEARSIARQLIEAFARTS